MSGLRSTLATVCLKGRAPWISCGESGLSLGGIAYLAWVFVDLGSHTKPSCRPTHYIFASLHSLEGCDRSFVPPLRALRAPLLWSSACIAFSIGIH